ncbi:MAG: carboxypeptidase-like regulatory domain-containing protein [Thermoplasmatota archaeon]
MRWIVFLLLVTALAGCSEATEPVPDDEFGEFEQELEATEDTGIIRGVVVDTAVVPIAGVTVNVQGRDLVQETDENGQFGFDGLEPGTYFLELSKIGYIPVRANAEVQAAVAQPPVVKVRMEADLANIPYASTQHHKGYYQCGLSFVVVCGAPNVLTDGQVTEDSSTHTFYFDPKPQHIQSEMVWRTTQAVSPDLRLEVETLDDGCSGGTLINNTLGPSPLRIVADGATLAERGVGTPECGLYHSVFAGDVLEQAHCGFWDPVPLVKCGVGFSIEQEFEWFITSFHGFVPDEDYWYIEDGAPTPPS